MKWITDNYKVFEYKEGRWMLTWIELDKTEVGTNVENFGITANYCVFCGKKIEK